MNNLLKNPSFILGSYIIGGIATGYCVSTALFFPKISYDPKINNSTDFEKVKRERIDSSPLGENKLFIQNEFGQLKNSIDQSFKKNNDILDKKFDDFGKRIRYGN